MWRSMKKDRKTEYISNLKRCPLLKITKKIFVRDNKGNIVSEETEESFSDCFRSFCMAWDDENKACTYFDMEIEDEEEYEDGE